MAEEEDQNWNSFSNELIRGGVSVAQCQTTDDAQFVVYLLWQRGIAAGSWFHTKRWICAYHKSGLHRKTKKPLFA
jgi:hypothetical protein